MPTNKNAYHRYRILNERFKTGRKFSLQQLADACEYNEFMSIIVSPRTIRQDITDMRQLKKMDIRSKEGLYWYADPKANMMDSPLTDADVSELNRISQILQQFDYLPQLDGLQNLILKLRNQVGLLGERPEDVIAFEQVVAEGVSFLTPIYKAIVQKRPLSVAYHPFDFKEPIVCVYHPYFLKEFNNRWYAITHNATHQRTESIALDRIVSLEVLTDVPYRLNEDRNLGAYYADLIGVTRPYNSVVERIVLRFKPFRAKYVKSKKWHSSQEIISDTEGSCDIGFQLIVNKELIARILEFGDDVQVIEPLYLREEVLAILKRNLAQYTL